MKAIILAAGYATRLYPLTKDKAKPLLPVGGKPMVEHIIGKIEELGVVDQVYIVTNEKFFEQFVEWEQDFSSSIPVTIINDGTTSNEDRLGAIGDKMLVMDKMKIDDDILDISGDNLFNFSLKEMYDFFLEKKSEIVGLYDIKDIEAATRFGICAIDEDKKVIDFQEKPDQPPSTLASTGIYMYPKRTVGLFRQYLKDGNKPDAPGFFLEWLHKREDMYGWAFDDEDEKWYDIGSLDQYEAANKDYEALR
jgi:glucose-1-phosphate thymidylyltransferase|tara:strand:+ start:179 stop:928 length:750 start_codon:yes stop_codon:yes gene_type:complete